MTTHTKQANFLYKIRISEGASNVGRFAWHFLEMVLAMQVGGLAFLVLLRLIPESSSFAPALARGTYLRPIVSGVLMTLPMVAWMIFRGHGWRHSLEMAAAMLIPVAGIITLRILGADVYAPWLAKLSCASMYPAMLAAMLYRRDHYTGQAEHSAHTTTLTATDSSHTH